MGIYGAVLMIRFLAEISFRSAVIIHAVPSNGIARTLPASGATPNIIYEITISAPPESSYWLDWGGWYDNFTGTQIELYFGQFLQHVTTQAELLITPFSLYIAPEDEDGKIKVYFNIPKHPWLYPYYAVENEAVIPFLTSPLDSDKPSRNNVRGYLAEVRLEAPNFTVKLSDNISGVVLSQGFSLSLHNDDGYFDNDDEWDLFNTPVHLKKSLVENPAYEDFREIRTGYAGSTKTGFDTFTIEVLDKLRSMEEPVCAVIQQADFPSVTLSADVAGKNIPVIYGTKKIKLIKLDDGNHYLAAEYASAVSVVYDKDNNTLPCIYNPQEKIIGYDYSVVTGVYNKDDAGVPFTYTGGILRTVMSGGNYPDIAYITDSAGYRIPHKYDKETGIITYVAADTALVTGYTANKIEEIATDIITRKTAVVYSGTNWNEEEIDAYTALSPAINIVFTSGNVKKAVDDALKSDMAYFIQQTDGRFTIRKYGQTYGVHTIPPWVITKKPDKDFDKAQENYFSSCVIKYNFTEADRNTFSEYYYNEQEAAAEDRYRKRVLQEYETDLISAADARALAELLANRYTVMRQKIRLSVGIDTAAFELLDTVSLDLTINGRRFSNAGTFIIAEINPAQDILTLEEL
jgi:hypothetical protein